MASRLTNQVKDQPTSNSTAKHLARLVVLFRLTKSGFGVLHPHHAVRFRSWRRPFRLWRDIFSSLNGTIFQVKYIRPAAISINLFLFLRRRAEHPMIGAGDTGLQRAAKSLRCPTGEAAGWLKSGKESGFDPMVGTRSLTPPGGRPCNPA